MMARWRVRIIAAMGRLTLLLYPRTFRRAYGADMVDVLTDVCVGGAARQRGTRRFAGPRALLLMARNGIGERLRPRPHSTLPTRPRLPRGERGSVMSSFRQDTAYALRSMLQQPGFTVLTVGMLAFGIAANTTVFTLYNAVFLRPLPFPEPAQLIDLDETAPAWNLDYVGISYPDFHAWRENNSTFESMAVFSTRSFNLADEEAADRVRAALTSEGLLELLGLQPALGRGFTDDDHVEGAEATVMLTDSMWRERFDASPEVVGSTMRIDGSPVTVIGVLPADAVFPLDVDLWAPLQMISFCCDPTSGAGSWWLDGVGRLKPGATVQQAAQDLDAVHAPLAEEFGDSRTIATPRIQPLTERYLGNARPMMLVMLAAVALLLVITCANVGGLLLARSTARHREVGIRMALGAGRRRIVRQLFTESTVLALAGGAVGLLLARVAMTQVIGLIPQQSIGWVRFGFDARVFGFAALASGAAAILFGLAPAISASSSAPQVALQHSSIRTSGGPAARRALSSLVVVEVALAVVLLVGSVLLVQATQALNDVEPGFRQDVLTFSASLPPVAYPDHFARQAFFEEAAARLASGPGVEAVGFANHVPLGGHTGNFYEVPDSVLQEDDTPVVLTRFVSPEYFGTVGIELLAGRAFDDDDGVEGRRTLAANGADDNADNDLPVRTPVVVNETFARTFWGRTDVLGRTFGNDVEFAVVGVTRDTKHYGLDQDMRPGIFLPHRYVTDGTMTLVVRGGADPAALTPLAREAVRQVDAEVPIFGDGTLDDAVYRSMWQRRLAAVMIGIFASAALALSLAGIHGTISFTVGQRTRELGIRMALGAQRDQVIRRVLRHGVVLTGIGLLVGLAMAFAGAGFLSAVLFGVTGRDPLPYVLVATVLVLATIAATFLPARRAARTDLVEALRRD